MVEPDTLRLLNSPFADSKIAGVAGSIRVLNLQDGILPRMMDVNFVFGFEIMRSAQSVLGSVSVSYTHLYCNATAISQQSPDGILTPVITKQCLVQGRRET